jgi:ABC-type maltose transport system permease subunit
MAMRLFNLPVVLGSATMNPNGVWMLSRYQGHAGLNFGVAPFLQQGPAQFLALCPLAVVFLLAQPYFIRGMSLTGLKDE